MTVNTEADLMALSYPAAYEMVKTVKDESCETTTVAHVIKVDDAFYLMVCTGVPGPIDTARGIKPFQVLDKRSPLAMLEKFAGYDFISADVTFTKNPMKPEVKKS